MLIINMIVLQPPDDVLVDSLMITAEGVPKSRQLIQAVLGVLHPDIV